MFHESCRWPAIDGGGWRHSKKYIYALKLRGLARFRHETAGISALQLLVHEFECRKRILQADAIQSARIGHSDLPFRIAGHHDSAAGTNVVALLDRLMLL